MLRIMHRSANQNEQHYNNKNMFDVIFKKAQNLYSAVCTWTCDVSNFAVLNKVENRPYAGFIWNLPSGNLKTES